MGIMTSPCKRCLGHSVLFQGTEDTTKDGTDTGFMATRKNGRAFTLHRNICMFLSSIKDEREKFGSPLWICHLPNLCPAPLFLSDRTLVLFRATQCPGKELHFSASLEVQVDIRTGPSL